MIGIVGAGISGLSLGVALEERGVPFRIFEASEEPGGVIRTVTVDGRTLELGPQRVRPVPELCPLLRKIPGWVPPDPAGPPRVEGVSIARRGRLHPVPRTVTDSLRTGLLSTWGKLRIAAEPFRAGDPDAADRPAAAFLRHRVGREAYEALFGPLFGGLYGSDPEAMDAGTVLLPALREMGAGRSLVAGLLLRRRNGLLAYPPVVPPGGMAALPRALTAALAPRVELGRPVEALRPGRDGGWELLVGGEGVAVERVVLTTPPDAAASLLEPADPAAAEILRSLHMNPLVLVHLDVDPLPPGLGFQVAFDESSEIRGMTFSGHFDGSGRTAVAFMGGMADPGVVDRDDDRLMETAVAEAERWTRARVVRPLLVSRTRMPAWDRSWRALRELELPPGVHLHANYVGRPGIIGRVREGARLSDFLLRQRGGS
jgi:protoporphyrinogen/coproporphyrinogen III oxidase